MGFDPLAESEAALNYRTPADSPATVVSVGWGETESVPDPVASVVATWTHEARPGVFTTAMELTGNWRASMDAAIRVDVFQVEQIYALLGGWPPATPLPGDFTPPGDGAAIPL